MCGIAGFADLGLGMDEATQLLHRMTDIIAHRGPDDEGHWLDDGVGLGMRRLSIIDVAGGHQPIFNEDGSIVTVFNGEIYNYHELRHALESRGHSFATNSDTETIAHAYEDEGLGFVHRLRGMFAIALWDRRRSRLVLARDRFGKKPLYYTFDGKTLVFASEIKSLLLAPGVERRLDPVAVAQYFTYGYIPTPLTALSGIYKLPAGHLLTLEAGTARVTRYWALDFTAKCEDDEPTAINRVQELLSEAVRVRLVSDVPLGAFLSGGIDSSTVVALMSQASSESVKTFSIGFEEHDYSEVEYARLVARRFNTEHHEFIVRLDLLDVLPRLIWDLDEPFADASLVPTYYVSKLARQHVTVALSGDGGDEIFAGYMRYSRALADAQWARRLGPARMLAPWLSAVMPAGTRGKNGLRRIGLPAEARYIEDTSVYSTVLRARLLKSQHQASSDPRAVALARFGEVPQLDLLTRLQHVDVGGYLTDDILMKVDRASMLCSLETRTPLLDHKLAEYVASLPSAVRNPGGRRKHLLRQAVRGLVPDAILDRPKRGFKPPLEYWLRGELRPMLLDLLHSRGAQARDIIDLREIERLLTMHVQRTENHDLRLWAWLCFELWCRTYLDNPMAPLAPPERPSAGVAAITAL